jgi:hypothetical protein
MNYPKWMYHATLPACVVQDPIEQEELGDDWAETPAAFIAAVTDEVLIQQLIPPDKRKKRK